MTTARLALLFFLAACGAAPRAQPIAAVPEEPAVRVVRRFDGARRVHLAQCTPEEPVRLTVDGPSAVAPTQDRPMARLAVAVGDDGSVIVWVTAGDDGEHDGTWVVIVDREWQVRSATRIAAEHWTAKVALVDGGAVVVGDHAEREGSADRTVDAIGVTWNGVASAVAHVAPGALLGLAGDRDALAVVSGASARTTLVRLGFDGHRVVPSVVVESLHLDVRTIRAGLDDGRLAVRGARWAVVDADEDVLTSEGRVTVPSRAEPNSAVERRLAYDDDDVLVVEELSAGRVLTRAIADGLVQDRSDVELVDARTFADTGTGAVPTSRPESDGTSVLMGPNAWDLDDDGSWGHTWLGWDGRRFVLLYVSPDQLQLSRRFVRCG